MNDEQNMQHPEEPVIIIERDDKPSNVSSLPSNTTVSNRPDISPRRWSWLSLVAFAVLTAALVAALFAGYKLYNYYHIGIPVSTSPDENIARLQQPVSAVKPEVVFTSDTILDVPLNLYALHGLKGSIEFTRPDSANRSVYLFTRCADYTPDGKFIGSLVAGGKVYANDRSRLGYMAMADSAMVIGIARSDKVKDYVAERGGAFFRQFILVSDGVLPPRFHLHGKVERRAMGRIGNTLYYVATPNKETLWDFADALREYGFTDAIYITGGNAPSFYRTADGSAHDIGVADSTTVSAKIPWLVFSRY